MPPFAAALLSFFFPGLGQASAGNAGRAAIVAFPTLAVLGAFAAAALKGAVDYLRSVSTSGIGFYSTPYQWDQVTGGTSYFAAYPSWVAGANSAAQAVGMCGAKGFTGGRVELVQYHAGGFDADFLCPGDAVAS
jgi:hypothetical protein